MFLKSKICTTVLVVYEILIVMLLHCGWMCAGIFGTGFCSDTVFKYFIMCFAVPAVIGLIIMWISEIVYGVHRRHSVFHRAKTAAYDVFENIKERVGEHVSKEDLEKLIVAALLLGVKRYASRDSKRRGEFEKILGKEYAKYGDRAPEYDDDEYDDDDDDAEYAVAYEYYDEDDASSARRTRNATQKSASRKSTKGGQKQSRKR